MNLPVIQTDQQSFALFRVDESEDMFRLFGYEADDADAQQFIARVQSQLIEVGLPQVSGLVLDPRFGFSAIPQKVAQIGLLFRLTEQIQPQMLPKILPNWGVEQIKSNFALCFFHIPYHPAEESALEKKKFVSEIYDFCQFENISLVLDLEIVGSHGGKIHQDELPEVQLVAVQELQRFCDAVAISYPGEALQAATITAQLDVPWFVTGSGETTYDQYKEQLRAGLESGARGFCAGKPIWQEITQMRQEDMTPDTEQMSTFIENTIRDRLIELTRISNEVAQT